MFTELTQFVRARKLELDFSDCSILVACQLSSVFNFRVVSIDRLDEKTNKLEQWTWHV